MSEMIFSMDLDETGHISKVGFKEVTKNDSLQHFGIKGMKWGVRRDNPSGGSSGSSSRRSGGGGSSDNSAKPGLSKKQKIAIGVGAGVAIAGTAVGVALLAKNGKLPIKQIREGGKTALAKGKSLVGRVGKSQPVSTISRISKREADDIRREIKGVGREVRQAGQQVRRDIRQVGTDAKFKRIVQPIVQQRNMDNSKFQRVISEGLKPSKISNVDDFIKKLNDPKHIWEL